MNRKLAVLLGLLLALSCIAFTACGDADDVDDADDVETTAAETTAAETTAPASQTPAAGIEGYEDGYTGDDPAIGATYEYMADEIAEQYGVDDDTIHSIPAILIVDKKEGTGGQTDVYGEFEVYNYTIEGDTLKCVSGGSYPGVMHVVKDEEDYEVQSFDQVADGGNFEPSAREIFGDNYDAFMKVYSDDEEKNKVRTQTVSDYVKANGLKVTKYQDEGWDPVELNLD